jgi:hypothetical protein
MLDSPNGHHQSKRWWRKTKTGSLTMAQMHASATEHALENQRVGGLQIRVASICAAAPDFWTAG